MPGPKLGILGGSRSWSRITAQGYRNSNKQGLHQTGYRGIVPPALFEQQATGITDTSPVTSSFQISQG